MIDFKQYYKGKNVIITGGVDRLGLSFWSPNDLM
jgi:hypothetical protein